jgi:secondary thiamine-phosphate synthase enzyme
VERIFVNTQSHTEFVDLTREIKTLIARFSFKNGMVHLFVPHTTAAITVNENSDPAVQYDMLCALNAAVPWTQPHFRHAEGNSAAHVKASLMGCSAALFVENGELMLGQWQGVFFCEFDGPRQRQVWARLEPSAMAASKFGKSNPI